MITYSVTLRRKVMTTIFEGKGRSQRMIHETRYINETYHELPYQTAMTYRNKFPDAFISMEREPEHFVQKYKPTRARVRYEGEALERSVTDVERPARKSAAPKPKTGLHTGDYSELVNRMVEKEKSGA